MIQTSIQFNQSQINVNLIGTDQKLLPSLIHALNTNKLTLASSGKPPVRIDLFSSEAFLYSEEGNTYRIPIF